MNLTSDTRHELARNVVVKGHGSTRAISVDSPIRNDINKTLLEIPITYNFALFFVVKKIPFSCEMRRVGLESCPWPLPVWGFECVFDGVRHPSCHNLSLDDARGGSYRNYSPRQQNKC